MTSARLQSGSLSICYNVFDSRTIEFADVEALLERLARDPMEDVELVQCCVEMYFMHIRVQLDGAAAAHDKLERFLSGESVSRPPREWPRPLAMSGAALMTVGALVLGVKLLGSRLYY